MKATEMVIRKLELVMNYISCIALLAMMLLLTFDTTGRYILSKPIQGSYEITEMVLMIAVVFLALSDSFKIGDQVKIDFFYQKFPLKVRVILDGIMYIFCALAFILIGYLGGELAYDAVKYNEQTFGVISLPMAFSYIWIPIGIGVLTIRLLFEAFKRFAFICGSSSVREDELNIGGSH